MDFAFPWATMAMVLLAVAATVRFLDRPSRLPAGAGGEIEITERKSVGQGHVLLAIRSRGTRLLVMTHPNGCTVLGSQPEGDACGS